MTLETTVVHNEAAAFLAQLREATAPMHAALEAGPLSTALLRPDVTVHHYAAYLHHMRDVIRFCEAQVFPLVKNAIADLEGRRKLHLIENDLEKLSPPPYPARTYQPFTTADAAFALGYLYVVEGSTLGGRVLLKQLVPKLPITEQSGGSFFAGYGKETAAQWKLFLQQFGSYVTQQACQSQTVAGAQHAFTSIARHFN